MKRALILLVMFASIAHAEDRKRAEELFRAGERAFRAQQYSVAAEHFEAAYDAAPIPEIAFSAAQAYRRQWFIDREPKPLHAKRAIELFRVYLETVKQGGRRGDASDGIAELQRELDKLTPSTAVAPPPPPKTWVAVSAVVAGEEAKRELGDLSPLPASDLVNAKATLDGKPVELYAPVEVKPGEHVGEVIADGYFSQKKTKQVIDGRNEVIEVVLQPKPAILVVGTSGRVLIDGVSAKSKSELPAGKHTIVVLQRGYEPVMRDVVLARGEQRTLAIDLEPTRQRRSVKWLLIGSGVLALAGGGATIAAFHYDGRMSDIEAKRKAHGIDEAEYREYNDAIDSRDFWRTSAYVLGGAAVVTAGVALGLYLFDQPSTEGIRLVPDPSGVSVVGRF